MTSTPFGTVPEYDEAGLEYDDPDTAYGGDTGFVPTSFTLRWYARLPDYIREADQAQSDGDTNYPLLRFLSTVGDQAGAVERLLEAITYIPDDEGGDSSDYSALTDPTKADPAWLAWLSQVVGIPYAPDATLAARRQAIIDAPAYRAHGTAAAITRLAQTVLTGTKTVEVVTNYGEPGFGSGTFGSGTFGDPAPGGANPWSIGIGTKASETPAFTTWASLHAAAPTWVRIQELGTWAGLEETGLLSTLEPERPAGFRFIIFRIPE